MERYRIFSSSNQNNRWYSGIRGMVMSEEEVPLSTILKYDKEALKKNIERHQTNVITFTEEVEKAKKEIERLKRYIDIIELHEKEKV